MRREILFLLALLILTPNISAWYSSSYNSRMNITCTNLTDNYPVVINGSNGFILNGTNQIVWTTCQGSATALYFNDSTNYIVANETTQIPMEVDIGNTASYNPTLLWTNYKAVYHMNKTTDSTGNFPIVNYTTTNITGKIDGGQNFSNINGVIVNMSKTIGNNITTSHNLSVEFWFQATEYGNKALIYFGNFGDSYGTMQCTLDTSLGGSIFCPQINSGANFAKTVTGTIVNDWRFIVGNIDRTNNNLTQYINGTIANYSTAGGTTALDYTGQGLYLGQYYRWNLLKLTGRMDEVRISTNVASAERVKQIYNNYILTNGFGNLMSYEAGTPPTPPTNTCTYTSGNWNIQCSDSCNLTTNTNLLKNNIFFNGTGTVTVTAIINNYTIGMVYGGCNRIVKTGGKIG